MAKKKKEVAVVKIQIPGAQANPAPPIGPALGQHGIKIMDFCTQFNQKTKDTPGIIYPTLITIYNDRTFSFVIKTPPAAVLIKREIGLAKGSAQPHKDKVGRITAAQIREIAKKKMEDMNAIDLEAAESMVAGTARSMGVDVIG